jgi:hypothetical protein
MNSPFAMEQAIHLAARQGVANGENLRQGVVSLFRFALGRSPEETELADAIAFLDGGRSAGPTPNAGSRWSYGWGRFDDPTNQTVFHKLPHFTGSAWQGGPELPDAKLGWVTLNANGGHPGNDAAHAAIRRWTAPQAGIVRLEGELKHSSDQGDGVRGLLISSRQGSLGQWTAFNRSTATQLDGFAVQAGETLDLLTDCRSSPNFDSFQWTVSVRLEGSDGRGLGAWNSASGFRGPADRQLGRWEQLAQVLLLTNEFAFVD